MPDDSMQDRRRHRRVAVDIPVRLSTIDPEIDPRTGRPFFRAWEERSTNVSRGGVLVHTREALAPGRRLLLELTIPEGPTFEAVARVAWTGATDCPPDSRELGIEFLGTAPDRLARLEKLLDRAPRAEA